ncbi:MAG: hypothetical protein JO122_18190 [Acetobacteraceae bacterium]|nr:hypothetical protein [Acetobacteraceae bacterium]
MKGSLLTGVLLLAVTTLGPTARAQTFEFNYKGSLDTFTVPIDGTYQIFAFGAQGGNGYGGDGDLGLGGQGAVIVGNFVLSAGQVLQIAVGGRGQSATPSQGTGNAVGGGGGGGSFVVRKADNAPLVVAGGGGGGGGYNLGNGSAGTLGLAGEGGLNEPGGNGQGGQGGYRYGGGGGGGFFSPGQNGASCGTPTYCGQGGGKFPWLAGGAGGAAGGFGGGGGSAGGGLGGPGGGGGYTGGEGGTWSPGGAGGSGGGGLSDEGTDKILLADVGRGDGMGMVVINLLAPTFAGIPGTSNCYKQSAGELEAQFGSLDAVSTALGYDTVAALQNSITKFCSTHTS